MKSAQKRARQIIRKYKLFTAPIDLNKIIDDESLTLDEWAFKGRVREVYVGDSIGILKSATPQKKRELIAHALGHHFLHQGNHMYFEENDQFTKFKQEHEAQMFASELLMPHALFSKVEHLSVKEIAHYFFVDEDLVKFFFKKGEICQ
jgi:Zn-dependent peptidase ImmA (M78 family)